MIWKRTWVGFCKIDSVRCVRCVFPTSCNAKISSCGWSRWAKVKEDKLHELPHVAFLTNKYGEAKQKWRKHDMNTTWTRPEHDMNTTCAEMAGKSADVWTMAQYGNVWHIKYGRIWSNELYLSWRYSAAGQSHKEQYGSLVFLGLPKNFIGAFFEGPRACSFLLARGGGTLKPSDWLGQQLLYLFWLPIWNSFDNKKIRKWALVSGNLRSFCISCLKFDSVFRRNAGIALSNRSRETWPVGNPFFMLAGCS